MSQQDHIAAVKRLNAEQRRYVGNNRRVAARSSRDITIAMTKQEILRAQGK